MSRGMTLQGDNDCVEILMEIIDQIEDTCGENSADMNIYTKRERSERKVFVETVKERLEKKYEAKSTPRINSVLIVRNVMYGASTERYEWARQEYRKDGETNVTGTEKLTVAADLQKVIMLPRADMFKEVIFTPRIIAFNESFVPVREVHEVCQTSGSNMA
ncbi:hypothetical protein JTB14_035084 [Gonioctena quinquepunctata]|nr:hypothetical protein JTB14_035084 [Gonioctena quinquepunctata]